MSNILLAEEAKTALHQFGFKIKLNAMKERVATEDVIDPSKSSGFSFMDRNIHDNLEKQLTELGYTITKSDYKFTSNKLNDSKTESFILNVNWELKKSIKKSVRVPPNYLFFPQ